MSSSEEIIQQIEKVKKRMKVDPVELIVAFLDQALVSRHMFNEIGEPQKIEMKNQWRDFIRGVLAFECAKLDAETGVGDKEESETCQSTGEVEVPANPCFICGKDRCYKDEDDFAEKLHFVYDMIPEMVSSVLDKADRVEVEDDLDERLAKQARMFLLGA